MGRWSCAGCARLVSATAGPIFQGTRTGLMTGFLTAWHLPTQKNGVSALRAQAGAEPGLGADRVGHSLLGSHAMGRN
jgi:hypothetical protein